MPLRKKYCFNMCILNLLQHLFISCLKVLVRAGTKFKPLVRPENSSSVKSGWKGLNHILILAALNFLNEDLGWFCGKRTLIDVGVYMHLNGDVDCKVASSLPMWFCVSEYTSYQCVVG